MKIVINVNKNGQNVLSTFNNGFYRYDSLKYYKDYINMMLNGIDKIDINDKKSGTISFTDSNDEVSIHGFLYNKNPDLRKIINHAKKVFREKKEAELRRKRIKRMSLFAASTILSTGMYVSAMINKGTDYEFINDDIKTETYDNTLEILNNEDKSIEYSIPDTNEKVSEYVEDSVDFGSRVMTEKYKNAKNNYYKLIKSIAPTYGIDPNIMLAIATQESGVHDINRQGPAMGLMQIELSVWNNNSITAFNHATNSYETIQITKDKLKDVSFNIKTACMIFQNYLNKSHNNLEVAIQMYNYGPGNVLKTFQKHYNNYSLTLNDVLNNYDSEWLNSRENIKVGDRLYLEHVLSYVEDLDSITCFDANNNEIKYSNTAKTL